MNGISLIDLVLMPQWVAWRNELRDGKLTKVPYAARDRQAKADDPTTWLPHDQAAAVAGLIVNGSGGGVGIELGRCGDVWLVGVDLDTCRDSATGRIEPWAQEVLDRLNTYSEVSPSGNGVKAYPLIDPAYVAELRRIMRTQHGRQFKRANGSAHPPAMELYISNRYFAVTWKGLEDAPAEMRPASLDDLRWLIEEAGPTFAGKPKADNSNDKDEGADTILARLGLAAAHNRGVAAALRNAATLKGGSRSEGALGLGLSLKRAGWSYDDMKAALLACPATREWATEKLTEGDRQFERIWHRQGDQQQSDEAPEYQQDAEDQPQTATTALGIWNAGRDDYIIPPREWLLGNIFCKKFLSSLIADGGVGKTAVRVAQILSLVIKRSLTGEHVFRRCRALIISFEDDKDELRRRVYAAMLHHEIKPADVEGWLFLAAPKGLKLAKMVEGSPQADALEQLLREAITTLRLDVVCLDPFIKTHSVSENDNNAIDFVCDLLATIAIDLNCAIDSPHHTNKGAAVPGDANKGRGASSAKDAGRLVYTLTPMTIDESELFELGEADRRSLIRLDSGKVNIAPPSAEAKWFRLIGQPLGNASLEYPAGDHVQTVEPWQPPDTWAGIDNVTLNDILDAIDAGMLDGQRFSAAASAGKRAAWLVVHEHSPGKPEKACRAIIKAWVKSGTLFAEDYLDPVQRKDRSGLRVNPNKRPT